MVTNGRLPMWANPAAAAAAASAASAAAAGPPAPMPPPPFVAGPPPPPPQAAHGHASDRGHGSAAMAPTAASAGRAGSAPPAARRQADGFGPAPAATAPLPPLPPPPPPAPCAHIAGFHNAPAVALGGAVAHAHGDNWGQPLPPPPPPMMSPPPIIGTLAVMWLHAILDRMDGARPPSVPRPLPIPNPPQTRPRRPAITTTPTSSGPSRGARPRRRRVRRRHRPLRRRRRGPCGLARRVRTCGQMSLRAVCGLWGAVRPRCRPCFVSRTPFLSHSSHPSPNQTHHHPQPPSRRRTSRTTCSAAPAPSCPTHRARQRPLRWRRRLARQLGPLRRRHSSRG